MKAYHDLLQTILDSGNDRGDRTGTGTRSCFGLQFRHNLQEGFPLLTTKKMSWKPIIIELLWFLKGDTNIKYLLENGVHIWSADAHRAYNKANPNDKIETVKEFEEECLTTPGFMNRWGDLGPIYGKQWCSWEYIDYEGGGHYRTIYIDQIKNVIESIRKNPEGRRHIVTAWNPSEIDSMALPPCHVIFQFYINNNQLSCHMYQRSADTFLGVPFNIASYALLTHIIAAQCSLDVGELIISFGDVHVYRNHFSPITEQLSRNPVKLPTLSMGMRAVVDINDYAYEDFVLEGYNPAPAIKGDLSVGT